KRTLVMVSSPARADVVDALRDLAEAVANAQFTFGAAQRVSLATHELVENAVRYGSLSSDIGYELSYDTDAGVLRVQVENSALPSRIAILHAHLERIRKLPPGGFSELMKAATNGRNAPALGLARIRFE